MSLAVVANDLQPAVTLNLSNGIAELMGEGLFILFQTDEDGKVHQVVLTEADLRKMLATR